MTDLVDRVIDQLENPWCVALESPTKEDWTHRWRGMMHRCDGIIDVIQVSDEYDPDDDRMMFLWGIALEHFCNTPKLEESSDD